MKNERTNVQSKPQEVARKADSPKVTKNQTAKGSGQQTLKKKDRPKSKGNQPNQPGIKIDLAALKSPLEMMSVDACRDVAKKDAPQMSNTPAEYTKANCIDYYLIINTWILITESIVGHRASILLCDAINQDGLIKTISTADAAAALFVAALCIESPTLPAEFQELVPWLYASVSDVDVKDLLQVLRYPKRFSPSHADAIADVALAKFYSVNKRCSQTNDRLSLGVLDSLEIIPRIREKISVMLSDFSFYYGNEYPSFSDGSTQNGKLLSKKLNAYSREQQWWLYPTYPIGDPKTVKKPQRLPETFTYVKTERKGKELVESKQCVHWEGDCYYAVSPTPVPKSYKSARIIAPEDAYHAAEKQRVRKAMTASLKASPYGLRFDPESQEMNRALAFAGSVAGNYATTDLTSASDSVAQRLWEQTFPSDVKAALSPHMVTHLNKGGGQLVKKHMAFTSGDPVCFITEGIMFLAIFDTAEDIYQEFTSSRPKPSFIFGDDGVCDTCIFELVLDMLEYLGFIPNKEKSFADGTAYRESCGVEFWNGAETTTKYWPRTELHTWPLSYESLGSVCSLQHKLFGWWDAQRFLTQFVRTVYPDMTSSYPGTDCFDLWEEIPKYAKRSAPHKGSVNVSEDVLLREAHVALTPKTSTHELPIDVQMYLYVQFLKEGPYFSGDPVLRLLGVSERRPTLGLSEKVDLTLRKVIR